MYDIYFTYRKTVKIVKGIVISEEITNTIPKCIDLLPDHHIGPKKRSTRSNDTAVAKKTCFASNIDQSESSDDEVVTPKPISTNQPPPTIDDETQLNESFGDVSLTDELSPG